MICLLVQALPPAGLGGFEPCSPDIERTRSHSARAPRSLRSFPVCWDVAHSKNGCRHEVQNGEPLPQ